MATEAPSDNPLKQFDLSLAREAVPGGRRIHALLTEAGEMARFGMQTLRELPGSLRYGSEILRHTRELITGTTVLMLFLMSMLAGVTALFGSYVLRSIGASDYVGLFTAFSGTRATVPIMFGYVFAAKVCCGMVAEIGSMRIHDEIEAFESVGLGPMRFVVAPRLMAVWLYVPIIFCMSSLIVSLAQGWFVVHVVGEVSQGNWAAVHWSLASLQDQIYAFVEVLTIATGTTLAACYYGFSVRGGPADVGVATGRSMIINLIFVHLVFGLGSLAFYGANPLLPVGAGA
jgi:phospholipid/cholesterol/gamma-HCH transport system permease protein